MSSEDNFEDEVVEPDVVSDGVALECPRCGEYAPVTVNWFITWNEDGTVSEVACEPDSSMVWVHEWACAEKQAG